MSHRALGDQFKLIRIEHIRSGMYVRPAWSSMPFEKATGRSFHDPDHPGNDEDIRMFLVPYARKFSPHHPEGTRYHLRLQ